ncbi:MAG: hypothetical protein HY796_00165 [Elusimicrobia bacterium]|nr:hypothetical protein [Elusimicrobiota bacterium]
MGDINTNQPATKADLNSLESKLDDKFKGIDDKFKGMDDKFKGMDDKFKGMDDKFKGMDDKFKGIDDKFKGIDDKFKGIDDKFKGMDDKFKDLSGEILKNGFKIDRLIDRLNTEFATKEDSNRIFNLLDAIAGDIKSYQRKDILRGDAVMRHEEQLAGHETRITFLEKK